MCGKAWEPFTLFGEVYSIDPRYNTQAFVTTTTGLDYARQGNRFDLVEDNDDQDRFPDAFRADFLVDDRQVFPGWDLNNDLVPDFNQNDNRVKANNIPDYQEPFLRFQVDRPEFLFGVDMNHNFWVDLYENDTEPDYPYRRDQAGFNVYGGVGLGSALAAQGRGLARGADLSRPQEPQYLRAGGLRAEYGRAGAGCGCLR